MAKKPTNAAKAAPASVALPLPPELLELLSAASVAAITAARATAEAGAKPGDEAAAAAATAAAELLVKASEAIDTWFVSYVAARLAAADTEAERQLEEKRATLKTRLEELDAKSSELTERRSTAEAKLAELEAAGVPSLNAALEELAAERGITPEEIIAFARDLLGGSAENITVLEPGSPAAAGIEVPEGMELIIVIGPAAGLRRAGHLFNANPLPVFVTPEQKALIAADPQLSLVDMQAELDRQYDHSKGERLGVAAFTFDPNGYTDVKVLGPKGGRRRIGHSFGPEESIVRVDASELEELLADNFLAVGQA